MFTIASKKHYLRILDVFLHARCPPGPLFCADKQANLLAMTHYALYVIITVWSNDLNTSVSTHNDSFIFQNVDLALQHSSLLPKWMQYIKPFFLPLCSHNIYSQTSYFPSDCTEVRFSLKDHSGSECADLTWLHIEILCCWISLQPCVCTTWPITQVP